MTRLRSLRELRRDESGVFGPALAVLSISLLAAAGLALDVGLYYMGNRDLRSATEAAALSAATGVSTGQAQARATDYLIRNGYDASVVKSVEIGYYCANVAAKYPAGSRFVSAGNVSECPGSSVQNAVRLTTGKPSRHFLTGIMGGASPIPPLAATASAARIDEAGVAVTSDLLRLNPNGITATLVNLVNSLLGGLVGLKLNLSAPDISALMSHNVDAGRFFDALGKGQSITYYQLTQGTYGMKDIAAAAAAAAYDPATASALRRFGDAVGNGYRVPLANMFGLGVWKNMQVGESSVTPGLRAGLNAYQLVALAAQAGPGVIDASDLVSVAVPGSTVQIAAVANGPIAQPRFSFGPAGETSVSTSQLRIQLMLGLGQISLPLGLANVNVNQVPVLIDIAPSAAQIAQIACANTADQAHDTVVKVNAASGLVRAYIADVPAGVMGKQMLPIEPVNAANLINADVSLGVIKIATIKATAKVVAAPVTGAARTLTFGPGGEGTIGSPQKAGISASLQNGSQVATTLSTLITGLSSGLDVQVQVLNGLLGLSTKGLLTNAVVGGLVQGISTPLLGLVGSTVDPLLDSVLAALGIQLGDATVWATGARCGVPVLI